MLQIKNGLASWTWPKRAGPVGRLLESRERIGTLAAKPKPSLNRR
jgi:hypothetical protein